MAAAEQPSSNLAPWAGAIITIVAAVWGFVKHVFSISHRVSALESRMDAKDEGDHELTQRINEIHASTSRAEGMLEILTNGIIRNQGYKHGHNISDKDR